MSIKFYFIKHIASELRLTTPKNQERTLRCYIFSAIPDEKKPSFIGASFDPNNTPTLLEWIKRNADTLHTQKNEYWLEQEEGKNLVYRHEGSPFTETFDPENGLYILSDNQEASEANPDPVADNASRL